MSRPGCPSKVARSSGLVLLMAVLLLNANARAHPESFSNLRLTLAPAGMHATVILPLRDLTRWFPPGRYKNYTADVARELGTTAGDLLLVAWDDQLTRPTRASAHPGQVGFVVAEVDYPMPADAGTLAVRSVMLGNLPNDHQELVMIEDARRGPASERILAEQTLTADQPTLTLDLPDLPPAPAQATVVAASAPRSIAAAGPQTKLRHFSATYLVGTSVLILTALLLLGGYRRRRGRGTSMQI